MEAQIIITGTQDIECITNYAYALQSKGYTTVRVTSVSGSVSTQSIEDFIEEAENVNMDMINEPEPEWE